MSTEIFVTVIYFSVCLFFGGNEDWTGPYECLANILLLTSPATCSEFQDELVCGSRHSFLAQEALLDSAFWFEPKTIKQNQKQNQQNKTKQKPEMCFTFLANSHKRKLCFESCLSLWECALRQSEDSAFPMSSLLELGTLLMAGWKPSKRVLL